MSDDDLKILKQLFDDMEKWMKERKFYGKPIWMEDFEWFINNKRQEIEKKKNEFIKEDEMEI